MCRIDYRTRGTTAQSTGLTDSQTANHTNRNRQEKHCRVLSRQVWLSNTTGKDGESDRHNASQAKKTQGEKTVLLHNEEKCRWGGRETDRENGLKNYRQSGGQVGRWERYRDGKNATLFGICCGGLEIIRWVSRAYRENV